MNPEPNLTHEQPPPPAAVLTDMPVAAMASPSSSSSTSSVGSKSSNGVKKDEKEEEVLPRAAGDDLSTPPLIAKVGGVPPAVAAAVSSYVLPKPRKARRSAKKKGDDASGKPRRPLSAYNYFFKENRAMLLAERDEKLKLAKENGEGTEGIESGYGFFGTMAKVIAQRWKVITPDSLEVYKKKAEIDSKRYRDEMEEFNMRKRLAPKPLEATKKGKKAKVKATKKEKLPKGADLAAAAKYGKNPALIEDARALAGVYGAPQDFAMQSQAMARFAPQQQGNSGLDYASMGLGGAGMGMLQRSANQFMGMGQADLEAQLALLQQQRQLEAMGLYSQATRPALLGIPTQQLSQQMMGGGGGAAGGGGGMQPQFMFEQVGFPNTMNLFGGAGQAPMSDLSFSSRMDNYAQQQQQQQHQLQQQQQHEQESAMLRQQQQQQQMMMNAQQDPGYANLLLQLRLQEQEERLRNQAAMSMGQGRW